MNEVISFISSVGAPVFFGILLYMQNNKQIDSCSKQIEINTQSISELTQAITGMTQVLTGVLSRGEPDV